MELREWASNTRSWDYSKDISSFWGERFSRVFAFFLIHGQFRFSIISSIQSWILRNSSLILLIEMKAVPVGLARSSPCAKSVQKVGKICHYHSHLKVLGRPGSISHSRNWKSGKPLVEYRIKICFCWSSWDFRVFLFLIRGYFDGGLWSNVLWEEAGKEKEGKLETQTSCFWGSLCVQCLTSSRLSIIEQGLYTLGSFKTSHCLFNNSLVCT